MQLCGWWWYSSRSQRIDGSTIDTEHGFAISPDRLFEMDLWRASLLLDFCDKVICINPERCYQNWWSGFWSGSSNHVTFSFLAKKFKILLPLKWPCQRRICAFESFPIGPNTNPVPPRFQWITECSFHLKNKWQIQGKSIKSGFSMFSPLISLWLSWSDDPWLCGLLLAFLQRNQSWFQKHEIFAQKIQKMI